MNTKIKLIKIYTQKRNVIKKKFFFVHKWTFCVFKLIIKKYNKKVKKKKKKRENSSMKMLTIKKTMWLKWIRNKLNKHLLKTTFWDFVRNRTQTTEKNIPWTHSSPHTAPFSNTKKKKIFWIYNFWFSSFSLNIYFFGF